MRRLLLSVVVLAAFVAVPAGALARDGGARVQTVAGGLEIPWEIAFFPGDNGRALVTERPGRVRILSTGGNLRDRPAARVRVSAEGEGGLLGLAFDPNYERNHFVYSYLTRESGMKLVRFRFRGGRLRDERVLMGGIRAGRIHDSGRIAFGPDGALYVATGDAGVPELAQDPNSRNGKFLRIPGSDLRDGGRARPQIVSLGHRNPQGIDFQPGSGRLVATEHGQEACDEVNVIRQGNNYGWPEKDCRGQREAGFTPPKVLYESPGIAPSGSTFVRQRSRWRGDYLVAGLKGQQISQVVLKGNTLKVQRVRALFRGDFGRIRTVVQGPDALYALTSNGTDDRILRITPPSRG